MVESGRYRRSAIGRPPGGLVVEALAQRRKHGAADRERAVLRIGARNRNPRRLGGAGAADERLADGGEVVVAVVELPGELVHAPGQIDLALELFQALLLLFLRQVEPELEHQHALVTQHLLHALDLGDAAIVFRGLDAAEDAIEDGLRMPGPEKNANLAAGRQ